MSYQTMQTLLYVIIAGLVFVVACLLIIEKHLNRIEAKITQSNQKNGSD